MRSDSRKIVHNERARCKIDPEHVIYDFCFMTLGEECASQGVIRPLHPASRLMTIGESWLARNTQQAFFMRFHVVHPQLLAAARCLQSLLLLHSILIQFL
jgi:hypothetical protein